MLQNSERRIYGRLLIGLLALAALLLAYFTFPEISDTQAAASSASTVKEMTLNAVPLQKQTVNVVSEYIGYITPIKSVDIKPNISGYLQDIKVDGGQEVKQGDKLIIIQQNEYKAQLDAAAASVAQAQANYNNASVYYQRVKKASSKAVSKTEFDNVKAQFLSAQAALAQAKANHELAKVNYGYTVLQAPIDGIVGNVDLTRGNYVSPASAPLLKIIQYNPIRVVFSITDKEYLREIKNNPAALFGGENIKLRLANGTVYPQNGEFKFTANEIDKATNSIAVYADFVNPDKVLVANAYVDVMLERSLKNVYLIRQNYVDMAADGNFVYTVRGGKLYKNTVDIAAIQGNDYVVAADFAPDEYLVTDKVGRIPQGTQVKVKLAAAPKGEK